MCDTPKFVYFIFVKHIHWYISKKKLLDVHYANITVRRYDNDNNKMVGIDKWYVKILSKLIFGV